MRMPETHFPGGWIASINLKHITWILFLLVFASILPFQAVYRVEGASSQSGPSYAATEAALGDYSPTSTIGILLEAHKLMAKYGTRPYWPLKPFRKGENVPADLAPEVIAHLIPCESQGRSISIIDSNNLPSRGTLMFQDKTWASFSQESGITGDPMNPIDAVQMGLWAVENGKLKHWSCAKLLHIVK